MDKKMWNFKMISTPKMKYCMICDAVGGYAGKYISGQTPDYPKIMAPGAYREPYRFSPIEKVFALMDTGCIIADVFPLYGTDVNDSEMIRAFNKAIDAFGELPAIDHNPDLTSPTIIDVVIEKDDKGYIKMNTHTLNWDKVVKEEYEYLQTYFLSDDRSLYPDVIDCFNCRAFYISRLYDLTQPATVELLIENGADISAEDYLLFRVARKRYPKLWVWLCEHYKEVIVKNLNTIYEYDKETFFDNQFTKSFDKFVADTIGEKDIDDIETMKPIGVDGLLDNFFGFKEGFFDK